VVLSLLYISYCLNETIFLLSAHILVISIDLYLSVLAEDFEKNVHRYLIYDSLKLKTIQMYTKGEMKNFINILEY
jgi:hypothetical protein